MAQAAPDVDFIFFTGDAPYSGSNMAAMENIQTRNRALLCIPTHASPVPARQP